MKRITTQELVLFGLLAALVFVLQIALSFLPNVELVTLLFILYVLVYGPKAFLIIYAFVFLEGVYYGFGLWWMNYLYVWAVQAAVTLLFRKEKSMIFWALMAGIYGITFGTLCSIPYFFMGGVQSGFAYIVSGLSFDLVHAVSNVVVTLILYKPIRSILEKNRPSA